MEENYGIQKNDVKWCMGVDVIEKYKLNLGNNMKKQINERM